MDDPMERDRDRAISSHSAPNAAGRADDLHRNGRHASTRDDRMTTDLPSSAKPALTDRERRERWPVD